MFVLFRLEMELLKLTPQFNMVSEHFFLISVLGGVFGVDAIFKTEI